MIEMIAAHLEPASQPSTADIVAKVQTKIIEQLEVELNEMRAAMSSMIADLTATADRERAQAATLAAELDAARRELDDVRHECRLEIEDIDKRSVRYCEETAARYAQELSAARERAQSAVAAEASAREQLAALQARNQEIADAQMLRIVELKRQLDLANATAAATPSEAPVEPARRPVRPDVTRHDPNRHRRPPEFAAIEAALAGSPPVAAAWERIA